MLVKDFEGKYPLSQLIDGRTKTDYPKSELMTMIENHLVKVHVDKPDIKETHDLYDHFMATHFEPQDMVESLKLVLLTRHHFDLDVLFFCKGMLYSSLKQHSFEE